MQTSTKTRSHQDMREQAEIQRRAAGLAQFGWVLTALLVTGLALWQGADFWRYALQAIIGSDLAPDSIACKGAWACGITGLFGLLSIALFPAALYALVVALTTPVRAFFLAWLAFLASAASTTGAYLVATFS